MNPCGTCEACCTWLTIDDPIITKAAGMRCGNLGSCGGCRIYEARPRACREFRCVWLEGVLTGSAPPPELRPDRCGVMLDAVGPRTLVARTTDERPEAWRAPAVLVGLEKAARAGATVIIGPTGATRRLVMTADPVTGRVSVRRERFGPADEKGVRRMVKR